MTSQELADNLGVSESYIRGHWQEILTRYEKIGIHLIKTGRGKTANYGMKLPGYKDYKF